ncbi:uncharacterized protein MONOS_1278 [Monocercomonoides exilis]|uniref:uncharacterized protein n=1 Tax=Monocercomonoides exilis TaxID=2049356 RepID=UPI00355A1159|nr:hypothetical protein MONOS_1278 [Monocercomonoides exilis]|eukprot:MONOS_1278.1-p1 / transcript=MONOS_1278.1 / gene=MONOS_1278 / organism=Monocercomonoides_exilis_PA203 / gene_product=unspecified product / transcript_product=unspecified product / location=Mono_scaffold00022:25534-28246(+) / protein_length=794 / sequence_SO=supercontig / SO=protein_coding / is_pseudo=false
MVCAGSHELIKKLVFSDIYHPVLRLMDSPFLKVQETAFWLLGNLAGDSPEIAKYLTSTGVTKKVVDMLVDSSAILFSQKSDDDGMKASSSSVPSTQTQSTTEPLIEMDQAHRMTANFPAFGETAASSSLSDAMDNYEMGMAGETSLTGKAKMTETRMIQEEGKATQMQMTLGLIQNAVFILVGIAKSDSFNKDLHRAIPICCSFINSSNVNLRHDSLNVVESVASLDIRTFPMIFESNCLPTLIRLLSKKLSNAVMSALTIIGQLAWSGSDAISRIIQLNGLPPIIRLAQNEIPSVSRKAMWTLTNIAAGEDEHTAALVAAGGLDVAVAALKDFNKYGLTRKEAAIIVSNVLGSRAQLKQEVANRQVMTIFCHYFPVRDKEFVKNMLKIIYKLLVFGSEEQRLIDEGILPVPYFPIPFVSDLEDDLSQLSRSLISSAPQTSALPQQKQPAQSASFMTPSSDLSAQSTNVFSTASSSNPFSSSTSTSAPSPFPSLSPPTSSPSIPSAPSSSSFISSLPSRTFAEFQETFRVYRGNRMLAELDMTDAANFIRALSHPKVKSKNIRVLAKRIVSEFLDQLEESDDEMDTNEGNFRRQSQNSPSMAQKNQPAAQPLQTQTPLPSSTSTSSSTSPSSSSFPPSYSFQSSPSQLNPTSTPTLPATSQQMFSPPAFSQPFPSHQPPSLPTSSASHINQTAFPSYSLSASSTSPQTQIQPQPQLSSATSPFFNQLQSSSFSSTSSSSSLSPPLFAAASPFVSMPSSSPFIPFAQALQPTQPQTQLQSQPQQNSQSSSSQPQW